MPGAGMLASRWAPASIRAIVETTGRDRRRSALSTAHGTRLYLIVISPMRPLRPPAALAAAGVLALVRAGPAEAARLLVGRAPERRVTTPVLGSSSGTWSGTPPTSRSLMPNGADPHEFQPSARTWSRTRASRPRGRERAEARGGPGGRARPGALRRRPVLTATDHVTLRRFGAERGPGDHGARRRRPALLDRPDRHARASPRALAPALRDGPGPRRRRDGATGRAGRLEALDARSAPTLAAIPPDRASW